MQGIIKAYSPVVNAGLVRGMDGTNYSFSRSQWSGEKLPEKNQLVTFDKLRQYLTRIMPQ